VVLDILNVMSSANVQRGRGTENRTAVSKKLAVGHLVVHEAVPGIGRVSDIEGDQSKIDCFESVAEPAAKSWWVPTQECRRVTLAPQTRVFWLDPSTAVWRVGRIIDGEPGSGYFVRLPNTDFDFPAAEADLRVRWDRPVREPHLVLGTGGHESGYFRDARLPMLKSIIKQRSACASVPAILSSTVEIYPHQVHAVMTILADPVQRYLLADEVGLGKTVEAGIIIRQTLLDNPTARIVVLTPEPLRRQWRSELTTKFFIDDFPRATIKISSHATPDQWHDYHGADLVVVDEAHELVRVAGPTETPYQQLRELAHSVPRLLLLSATPASADTLMYLGLLHLLDKDLYRWDDVAGFQNRFALRQELASAAYALSARFVSVLPGAVDRIQAMVPHDVRFRELADDALAMLDDDGELASDSDGEELELLVEAMRAHISETYRLHRRVIRHRRARVLVDDESSDQIPYEVRGRSLPKLVEVDSPAQLAIADWLLDWQAYIRDWLLDHDGSETGMLALVLAVLASRNGGSPQDFLDALRWRIHGDATAASRARLTTEEIAILTGPAVTADEVSLADRLFFDLAEIDVAQDLARFIDALVPVLRRGLRAVIFCGPGGLASELAAELGKRLPGASVGEHSAAVGAAASEEAVDAWRSHTSGPGHRILVADETAEDGLNLQTADVVVHCRLPWNPNRLEQRLGRVDRYRGPESVAQGQPAAQFAVTSTAQIDAFFDAWYLLLRDGFGVFDRSVSALQDAITQAVPEVWAAAIRLGTAGLLESRPRVREELDRETRAIDRLDMVESIHGTALEVRDLSASLNELESAWREIQAALLGYAGQDEGGQRFTIQVRHHRWEFSARGEPLIPPRMFRSAMAAMRPQSREAAFNRSAALSVPGTRLFRLGNPLIDMLATVVTVDDRGQAAAFRRFDPRHRGEPDTYFGFDYLVEADVARAFALLGNQPAAVHALRRQADRLLAPFMVRVWISAHDNEPVRDTSRIGFLDAPYNKNRGDQNFSLAKADGLYTLFGGLERYREAVSRAQAAARLSMEAESDLPRQCAAAERLARQGIAIARAQALARQAAGRLVGDADSYLMDVALTSALIDGLSNPTVQEVGAACVVVTGRVRPSHGA
jgi:ATP-dependent helicase HepA